MDDVDRYRRQVLGYRNIDGINELGFGLFGILWAGLVLWSRTVRAVDGMWFAVVLGSVGLLAAVVHGGTKWVRSHLTYPRTGFVRPLVNRAAPGIAALIALLMAPVFVMVALRTPENARYLNAAMGMGLGGGLFWKARQFGVGRFAKLGVVAALAGIAGAAAPLDLAQGQALVFGIFGVALLVSGSWTLYSYIKSTAGLPGEES